MNPILLKAKRVEAEIGRALFRPPVGGPVYTPEARCWRDAPFSVIYRPGFAMMAAVLLTSCEKLAGNNGLEMCDAHWASWNEES